MAILYMYGIQKLSDLSLCSYLSQGLCADDGERFSSIDDIHEVKGGKIKNKLQLIAKMLMYPVTFMQAVA